MSDDSYEEFRSKAAYLEDFRLNPYVQKQLKELVALEMIKEAHLVASCTASEDAVVREAVTELTWIRNAIKMMEGKNKWR